MALTTEQSKSLTDLLSRVELGEGLGTEDSPCSIAAVNLALYGRLTDDIPDCMSLVIGKWVRHLQDLMPHATRNCREYKIDLLPLAAGTGRDREKEKARFNLLADWMWERVLPRVSTGGWPATLGHAWEDILKARSLNVGRVPVALYTDVNLRPIGRVARVQALLRCSLYPGLSAIADAAVFTTFCIDADWEEGAWDDADGLDVIGTLERLIEV